MSIPSNVPPSVAVAKSTAAAAAAAAAAASSSTTADPVSVSVSATQQQQSADDIKADQKKTGVSGSNTVDTSATPQKEIYTYNASCMVYGLNWSVRPDFKFRLAMGSFIEEYKNKVEILQLNESSGTFDRLSVFDHPYPTTKIMWIPDKTGGLEDLLATTGDYLRIWKVDGDNNVQAKCLLNNVCAYAL
jgi:hypothetical protein